MEALKTDARQLTVFEVANFCEIFNFALIINDGKIVDVIVGEEN